ncbi:MAG: LptF/LptG family permease [Phycisphaerales bacterium]|nr:LptF/LptG family permease [Phycisphaerales bacterium]
MLWTLWRAILLDFLRLLLLTTAVVVCTIAFATTVKPLADGKLTAEQAIKFMGLAVPPMLAYALPFAAGFSATLTYHRLASENEATAVYAGGISHKRFLFPMLLSAIAIGGSLFILNDRIIPDFLKRMEHMVTRDFAQIFVNSLSQGEAAKIGKTEIHADLVVEMKPEKSSPIRERFLLDGVAMVEADDTGRVKIDGTSKQAWIMMLPVWALGAEDRERIGDDDAMSVVLVFKDMTINRDGNLGTSESFTSPAIPIPNVFQDDPKFMTTRMMHTLRNDPDQMNFVDHKRVDLARDIASFRIYTRLAQDARAGAPLVFRSSAGETITILARRIHADHGDWVLDPLAQTGQVEIEIVSRTGQLNRLQAKSAAIAPEAAKLDPLAATSLSPTLAFSLKMQEVLVLGPPDSSIPPTERAEITHTGLGVASDPLESLLAMKSPELLEEAAAYRDESAQSFNRGIANTANRLDKTIQDLHREILSKLHERWAFAAAGFMMVITGAITALRLRYAQPLVVYLWSFFPALLTIIFISGGQQSVNASGAVALPVLWLGIFLLIVYTLSAYRKVARN